MPKDFTVTSEGEQVETVEEAVEVEAPAAEVEVETQPEPEEETQTEAEVEAEDTVAEDTASGEFVEKKKEETSETDNKDEEGEEEETPEDDDEEDIVDSKKKRCSLENEDDKLAAIEAELEELRAFKRSVENKEKDALINKYHMLSDEEKAEVVAHKEEYTLEQIDEKLALIYVRNNVDFSTVDGHPQTEEDGAAEAGILNFSLNDSDNAGDVVDELQQALRKMKEN